MPAEALRTLKHAWQRSLEPFRLPMALTGGLALTTWKHPRATQDVDSTIDHRALDGFQVNAFLTQFVEALRGWR